MDREKIPQWRRNEIKERALYVLKKAKIGILPVDLRVIIRTFGWKVTSVKKAMESGIRVDSSDDGFSIINPTASGYEYLIICNGNHGPQRNRWTISHEIGHIVLGHLNGVKPVTDAEAEANYFARELLTPLAVLDKLSARSAEDIAKICDISMEAAKIRAGDFARRDNYKAQYGETAYDKRFLRQFSKMFKSGFAGWFHFAIAV